MDKPLHDALNAALKAMFADQERLKRMMDDVLAEQRARPQREDIRTILARIEAVLREQLALMRDLQDREPGEQP